MVVLLVRLIGVILLLISLSWIVTLISSIWFKLILIILGIGIFIWAYKKRKGWTLTFTGIVIIAVGIALILFPPILALAQLVVDVLTVGYLQPLILLIAGIFLIVASPLVYKLVGILIVFMSLTDSAGSVSSFFSAFGTNNPNYFLFAIALIVGLILVFKIQGTLPKVLGFFLPFLTLPVISNVLINNLRGYGLPDILGYSFGEIILVVFAVLSAIYIFTKLEGVSPNTKTFAGIFALLLVLFSFSPVAVWAIDLFAENMINPVLDALSSYDSSLEWFVLLFLGIICVLAGTEKPWKAAGESVKKGYHAAKRKVTSSSGPSMGTSPIGSP